MFGKILAGLVFGGVAWMLATFVGGVAGVGADLSGTLGWGGLGAMLVAALSADTARKATGRCALLSGLALLALPVLLFLASGLKDFNAAMDGGSLDAASLGMGAIVHGVFGFGAALVGAPFFLVLAWACLREPKTVIVERIVERAPPPPAP